MIAWSISNNAELFVEEAARRPRLLAELRAKAACVFDGRVLTELAAKELEAEAGGRQAVHFLEGGEAGLGWIEPAHGGKSTSSVARDGR